MKVYHMYGPLSYRDLVIELRLPENEHFRLIL